MTFNQIIAKAVRTLQPPTRYRLAKTLGITPSAIYEWQAGRAKPTGEHVLKMLELGAKKKRKGSATVTVLVTLAILSAALPYPMEALRSLYIM